MSELPFHVHVKSEDAKRHHEQPQQQQQQQQQQHRQHSEPAAPTTTRTAPPTQWSQPTASDTPASAAATRLSKSEKNHAIKIEAATTMMSYDNNNGTQASSSSSSLPVAIPPYQSAPPNSPWTLAAPYDHNVYFAAPAGMAATASNVNDTPFSPFLALTTAEYPGGGLSLPTPSILSTQPIVYDGLLNEEAAQRLHHQHHSHHPHYHQYPQPNDRFSQQPPPPQPSPSSAYPFVQPPQQSGSEPLYAPMTAVQSDYAMRPVLLYARTSPAVGPGAAVDDTMPLLDHRQSPPMEFSESSDGGGGGGGTTSSTTTQRRCSECGTSSSPEWRRDAQGHKSLCNACGLRAARTRSQALRRDEQASMADEVARNRGVIPETMQRRIDEGRLRRRAAAEKMAAARSARAAAAAAATKGETREQR